MGISQKRAASAVIAFGILGSGLTGWAATASAQDEILVTGSRLERSSAVAINPVTEITLEDIRATGHITVEDLLQELPEVTGGDLGASINNGSTGLATASLRGLGPYRTLVLIDGQRPAPVGVDGVVDLNLIPDAMIERVEILRDGASTIYGSDAIAGVINIVTRKDFEGIELEGQYDFTQEGDGETYSLSALFGRNFARGNLTGGVQYTHRDPIWQDERRFSECGLLDFGGTPFCDDSIFSYPPLFNPETDGGGNLLLVVDQDSGEVRDHSLAAPDAYNFAPDSYLLTPQEVFSVFGSGSFDILDSGGFSSVTARIRASWSQRDSDQQLAPELTAWTPLVPASNPFNPFGDDLCAANAAAGCTAPQAVYLARRMVEAGGRSSIQDTESWQVAAGFDGQLFNGWTWDLTYNHAEFDSSERETGRGLLSRNGDVRFDATLDPDLCAADPLCPGIWNPFAVGTFTPELQAYAMANPVTQIDSKLQVVQANLQGDLGRFELPGGAILWGVGVERRSEESSSVPDDETLSSEIFGVESGVVRGDYDVNEAYGEIRLPLLAGARFAEILALETSLRWSDYDFLASSDTNFKVGLEWAPVADLRFRAIWSEGFRAPNIDERVGVAYRTFDMYTDPCTGYGNPGTDPVVAANCASEGLPPDFVGFASAQAWGIRQGNEALEPESAENWTVGLVFNPEVLPDFVLTLDWFDVEIEDAIGDAGTQNIINACYASPEFSSPLCDLLVGPAAVGDQPNADPNRPFRNVFDDISGIDLAKYNLSVFETSGVDASIRYGFDATAGRVDISLQGTWLDEYRFQAGPGTPTLDYAGKFGPDPYFGKRAAFSEWKANLGVGLSRDAWGARWTTRYLSGVDDLDGPAGKSSSATGSTFYHDVQAHYGWEVLTLTAGIRNVFDRQPPYVTAYDDMNTLPISYDTAGRYYYVRANLRF